MSLMSVVEKLKQGRRELKGFIEEAAVIFIDMAGSTTFKDKRGIESGVLKVVYFNLDVTMIIKEKGEEFKQKGEIEEYEICKYIGDEVMAYFKGKNSSKVAVEIAIDIENYFKDANSEIRDEFEKNKPKIGIDFGEVLFVSYYENSPLDPHGLIVDRAARIVSLAKPCQILISEEAKNNAGDKVDVVFSEKANKKFDGIEEKTIVREVVWDDEIGELGMEPAVCGTYKVDGKNLLKEPNVPYSGLLQIEEQGEQLFEATWIIGTGAKDFDPSMESNKGTGLLIGNALAFSYEHTGKDGTYTGVVLYEIMSDNLMSGQWTIGKEYLFSIGAEFEDDLNKDIPSEKLKDKFKTEGFSISKNARITKVKNDKWEITGGEKIYTVRKENGKLNIYGKESKVGFEKCQKQ